MSARRLSPSRRVSILALTLSLGAACVSTSGCIAGGRTSVSFDATAYPVSMSPTVFGSDGEVLAPEAAEVVGALEVDLRAWSMLWGAVSLKRVRDVSAALNAQIQKAGGQAAVNVRIQARQCGGNYVVPLTLLPFYPGCAKIKITGDVIRERGATAPAAGAPAPTSAP